MRRYDIVLRKCLQQVNFENPILQDKSMIELIEEAQARLEDHSMSIEGENLFA